MKGSVSVVLGLVACAWLTTGADAWAQQPPPPPAPLPPAPLAPAPAPPTVIIVRSQPRASTMKSSGLVVGGGVMVGLGGVMLIIGIPVAIWGAGVSGQCTTTFDITAGGYVCSGSGSNGPLIGGIVTTLLGAGMVAGGAAMIVIGSESPEPGPTAERERNPLLPTLQLGAASAQLDWAF